MNNERDRRKTWRYERPGSQCQLLCRGQERWWLEKGPHDSVLESIFSRIAPEETQAKGVETQMGEKEVETERLLFCVYFALWIYKHSNNNKTCPESLLYTEMQWLATDSFYLNLIFSISFCILYCGLHNIHISKDTYMRVSLVSHKVSTITV